jgi:hypothetical protein
MQQEVARAVVGAIDGAPPSPDPLPQGEGESARAGVVSP